MPIARLPALAALPLNPARELPFFGSRVINVTRALLLPACGFFLASLFGCAAEVRPEAEGQTASELGATNAARAAAMTAPDPAHTTPAAGEPGAVRTTCKPREVRECRYYYTDASGQRQCPMDIQICQLDGKDWLPCGLYSFDANGNPQKAR